MRKETPPLTAPPQQSSNQAPPVRRPGPQVGPPALQAVFARKDTAEEELDGAGEVAEQAYDHHDDDRHDHTDHAGEEGYFFDDAAAHDGTAEASYDDPPRVRSRSTGGLVTAAVLIGCALFGTAAAYGYRTYSTRVQSGNAPIVTADNGPIKMVPATASADNQSGKAIQDRIGEAGGERIVKHQEEPVPLGDAGNPRVVLPAPFTSMPGAQGQGTINNVTTNNVMAGLPPPADAKKVRTVPIRPDGTEISPRTGGAPPAASQNQPIMLSPPSVNAAPPPSPPPASAAPKVATTRSAPPPRADAPLTLAPTDDAPVSQPPPRERSVQPQLASAPAATGAMVQLSAQRSEAEALAAYKSLQAKYPNELGDRPALVRRADLGAKGIYYRTLVGPFGSAADADQFCGTLKAAGGQCLILKN
jgi:hypothetical protein